MKCDWCGKEINRNASVGGLFSNYCSNKCKCAAERAGISEDIKRQNKRGCLWAIIVGAGIFLLLLILGVFGGDEKGKDKEAVKIEKNEVDNGSETKTASKTKKTKELNGNLHNFDTFIQSFVSNSNYQLSHIKFPLKYKGALGGEDFLKKEDWSFLGRNFIFQGKELVNYDECEGRFLKGKDRYTYELRKVKDSNVILKMLFSQVDGEWVLTEIEENI